MKQHAFRLAALLLCLALVFSLGACGGDPQEESTNPSADESINSSAENTLPAGESQTQPDETDTQAAQSTEPSETAGEQKESITAAEQAGSKTTQPVKTQQDSQPKTVAEIVAYYNKAANKIKTDKPGYTKKYTMQQFPGSQATLGSAKVPNWLMNLISKDETSTIKKGNSSNDIFPAAGFAWSSKLDPKYVKSATCTKSGSSYKIHITLKDETNPQVGKGGYGSCMSVIDKAGAQEMVPLTIKSITMKYHDGYITATVDIKTTQIISAELSASCKMENMDTSLGTINADLQSTETFTNFQW
ncbi:MAG TPA: hypothetical protein IAD07_03300 [Candidatus Fimivicinus intestinavium]|nr:hypothetical protein [Candidatus Fimivicinus intestinavium]